MPSRKWLILPIIVCLIGILPLNTSFYTLVRIIVFCSAIAVGLQTKDQISEQGLVMLGIVAVVFNPIFPIYINDKLTWIVLDLAAAGVFFAFLIEKFSDEDEPIPSSSNNSFKLTASQNAPTSNNSTNHQNEELIDVERVISAQSRVLQTLLEDIFSPLFNSLYSTSQKREFFEQDYVLGFITGYAACIEDLSFNGGNWSKSQRGSFYLLFYKKFMNGAASAMIKTMKDIEKAAQFRTRPNFLRGEDEGALVAVIHLGRLRKDFDEEILQEAKAYALKENLSIEKALISLTIEKFHDEWSSRETVNTYHKQTTHSATNIEPDELGETFIQKDWLIQKIEMKALELKYNSPEKTSHDWPQWTLFQAQYKSGDEVWEFDTPSEYWDSLSGCAGFVIIRDEFIIAELITIRN